MLSNTCPSHSHDFSSPLLTIMVIPSGIGCSIGGYAGDAIPAARLLASASGFLVTHPNVMNAGSLFWSDPRIHYVEGYSLDSFAAGQIALRLVSQQKIGLLIDLGIDDELRQRHIQVADACRASLGLNVGPVVITDVPLEVKLNKGISGASWGGIGNPEALLKAGENLKTAGATAIAVVTSCPDECDTPSLAAYRSGNGVDCLAGAEALVSHLLVRHLKIPCAHAPAIRQLPFEPGLDPRACAEEIGFTFLPSVLVGLSRAPSFVDLNGGGDSDLENQFQSDLIFSDQIGAVVAPQGALGGEAVLACIEKAVPLIVVDNPGVLNVNSESLGVHENCAVNHSCESVFRARNYIEVAGLLTLLREGLNIDSLQRPLLSLDKNI